MTSATWMLGAVRAAVGVSVATVLMAMPASGQSAVDFTVSGNSTVRGWTCTVRGTAQVTTGSGAAVRGFASGVGAVTFSPTHVVHVRAGSARRPKRRWQAQEHSVGPGQRPGQAAWRSCSHSEPRRRPALDSLGSSPSVVATDGDRTSPATAPP